jgi:hypothetical protein
MSQNLNLLRQKYCRPASFTGKRTDHLFPLEEECEQGKALLAKAPKTLLHLQEFDPYGLRQTYREEASGAELPVFAVFDLEGSHQLTLEITTDSLPTIDVDDFDTATNALRHRSLLFTSGPGAVVVETTPWIRSVALILLWFIVAMRLWLGLRGLTSHSPLDEAVCPAGYSTSGLSLMATIFSPSRSVNKRVPWISLIGFSDTFLRT